MHSKSNNLLKDISAALPTYSRAFKQLAEFILSKTFAASGMNIEELADAVGVSVATINRFAHSCGFDGYPSFRSELRAVFAKVFEPAEKLRSGALQYYEENEVIQTSFDVLLANIKKSKDAMAQQPIKEVVDILLQAEHIFIAGMGVSALHAAFMVEILEPFIGTKVQELNSLAGAERAIRRVSMLGTKDVLIAITIPRYSKGILEIVHIAKEQGAQILVLTDAPNSPLVSQADICLFASAQQPFLYASSAPLIALIEGICAAVALNIKQSAERLASQTELVLPHLYLPTDKK